jgi:hypothetical protein
MFCGRCGQQIPEAEICPLCGQETEIRLEPRSPMASAAPSPILMPGQAPAPAHSVVSGPSGIGGWLLCFCIVITILSPLSTMPRILLLLRFRRMPDPTSSLDMLRVFYGLVVGVFLWTKRPIALFLLRVYFIAFAVILALSILAMIAASMQAHSSIFLSVRFPTIGTLLGYMMLWFAYFKKSVRVRNTYGANL